MKTIANFLSGTSWFKISVSLLIYISFLIIPSCQKDELNQELFKIGGMGSLSALELSPSAIIYYGTETFSTVFKVTKTYTPDISNLNFKYFKDFVLKVQNGSNNQTKVTDVEILIDGIVVVTSKDLRKNANIVTKPVSLTAESVLEVKLKGPKDSFIKLLVECNLQEDVITDIEGNYYHTVSIGTQTWMAENLRTSTYNDGSALPNITDNLEWYYLTTPAYCWHNDEAIFKPLYGALYNGYAVNTGKLCPAGWHVSTDAEWTILLNYLGGPGIAGGKLKESGTTHWIPPNPADNSSGFTALPGGYRSNGFHGFTDNGYWWSTDPVTKNAWIFWNPTYLGTNVFSDPYVGIYFGYSVRCVQDN